MPANGFIPNPAHANFLTPDAYHRLPAIMYIFFHLFTGIVLGYLAAEIFRDARWVLPCIVGSILPDLIDKPIGILFFPNAIGNGRIFSHTLIALILLMAIGLAVWHVKKNPLVISLALGVFSHQMLELMWREPMDWLYPAFGPFLGNLDAEFFRVSAFGELHDPFEVVLALIYFGGLIAFFYREYIASIAREHIARIRVFLNILVLVLCALAGISIGGGIMRLRVPYTGWTRPEEFLLGGFVLVLAAYAVWQLRRSLGNGSPAQFR